MPDVEFPGGGEQAAWPLARRLAGLVSPIHNVSYYTPEIKVFAELGIKGWWTSYFAYRSAPMGKVEPEVITATFYGFALRMVARAVPAVWDHITPQQSLDVRLDAVDRAWRRIFADADGALHDAVAEAADAGPAQHRGRRCRCPAAVCRAHHAPLARRAPPAAVARLHAVA